MEKVSAPPIYVTERDIDTLSHLLDSPQTRGLPGMDTLRQELDRAHVVAADKVPLDVITMNSTVRFEDESAGAVHQLTLVYPRDTDGSGSKVSITAPVGSALIGFPSDNPLNGRCPVGAGSV